MKVLVVSKEGRALGLAQRVMREGHPVSMKVVLRSCREVGSGLIPTATPEDIASAELIIADNVPGLKSQITGVPMMQGSMLEKKVKDDATYTGKVLALCGIETPLSEWVYDYNASMTAAADAIIDNHHCVYRSSAGTHIMSGIADTFGAIRCHGVTPYELREYIPGRAVSVGAFWDGITFTGQHVVWKDKDWVVAVQRAEPNAKIVTQGLDKMVPFLKKTDYRGYVRISMVLSGSALYGLDIDFALDLPVIQPLFELYKGELTRFLNSIANGVAVEGEWHNGKAIGVKVNTSTRSGMPFSGVIPENEKHIWLHSAAKNEEGAYIYANHKNPLLYVTAGGKKFCGDWMTSCFNRVRRTLDNLIVEDGYSKSEDVPHIFSDIIEWL